MNAVAQSAAESIAKRVESFGVPWESFYGYAQAVQVDNVIYVSGQLSHDDSGKFIAPALLDAHGRISDFANMEVQMRTTYENAARLLQRFGATLENVVEETIYVLDVDAAFAVAGKVRKAAYGTERPRCASTLVGTTRLALPEQLVEISFTVVLPG
ncbi:MAG TPA: RidA family protein [Nitrospiraceae bacterium]|nr:RidA family protein [Nitrospiraceae bacterium]